MMKLIPILAVTLSASVGANAEEVVELFEAEGVSFEASTLRGLRLEVEDPELELRVGGRLHIDAALFDDDRTDLDDDIDVRRGRIYLRGQVLSDWSFKAEYELSDTQDGWRNLWGQWKPTKRVAIRLGNAVAPFGLEDVGSSNELVFMERALPSALAPSFQTGVRLSTNGRLGDRKRHNHWTFAVMGGLEPLGVEEDDRHKSEHYGISSRASFAPFAENGRVLHFGASFEYRDIDGDSRFRIRTRPESFLAEALLSTGRLRNVKDVTSFGLELASVLGPVSVQGEYLHSSLERKGSRSDPDFDGWYAQAAWIVTGEHRRYSRSRGVFGGVKPESNWGAVELALRYSELDLNDGSVSGGTERDWTIGANWWIRENVRLMANYVNVDAKLPDSRLDDEPDIFQFRFAVFF